MKNSCTLTGTELSQQVLDLLDDAIQKVCSDCVTSLNMQLKKNGCMLTESQIDKLMNHLKAGVNLNLTINTGVKESQLAELEIYPISLSQSRLDGFTFKEDGADLSEVEAEELEDIIKEHDPRAETDFENLQKRRMAFNEANINGGEAL